MILHYEECGSGIPLVILHGLLGSCSNWRAIAKSLSNACRVIAIDLPNHGLSPHTPDAGMALTCDSIIETMRAAGVDQAYILGHSMGGKIAMQLAADYPEQLLGVIVADMLPKAIPPIHLFILRACQQLDLSTATRRSQLDEMLAHSIPLIETRAFILKNIHRDEHNRFYWVINLENIIANYAIVSDPPHLKAPYEGRALFIGGDRSPFNICAEKDLILTWFPHARVETIEDAGHLIHTDQPEKLCVLLFDFLFFATGVERIATI